MSRCADFEFRVAQDLVILRDLPALETLPQETLIIPYYEVIGRCVCDVPCAVRCVCATEGWRCIYARVSFALPAPSGTHQKSVPRGVPMQHIAPCWNPES